MQFKLLSLSALVGAAAAATSSLSKYSLFFNIVICYKVSSGMLYLSG